MARKNRVVVPDGLYHIVGRVAHRAHLLESSEFKDRIVEWIHGIAAFAGVEVFGFAVMDNHIHIFVRVPPVPESIWRPDPTLPEGAPPCAEAFGMRPVECRAPRWTPDVSDGPCVVSPAGDVLSEGAVVAAVADGVPTVRLPRPRTGFTMSDADMLARLRRLYAGVSNGANKVARRWAWLRSHGKDAKVEAEKDAFCRRMYNVSQYAKTLFERIAMQYNVRTGHRGVLWEGRFYSGLVDDEARAKVLVSAYIAYNPAKAGMVRDASAYRWSSWAEACGDGPRAAHYRGVYARVFGGTWEEARGRMESLFAERLPERFEGLSKEEALKLLEVELSRLERSGGDGAPEETPPSLTIGQMIKVGCSPMRKGVFISFDGGFRRRVVKVVGWRFSMGDDRSVMRLMRLDSTLAWRTPRAA